jgi:hypothetical protein
MTHSHMVVKVELRALISALDGDEWLASGSVRFIPEKRTSEPNEKVAGWALKPVWMVWLDGRCWRSGNGTPTVQPVAWAALVRAEKWKEVDIKAAP